MTMISASIESGVQPSRSRARLAAAMHRSLLQTVSPASRLAATPAMPVTFRISSSLNSAESVRLSNRRVGTQVQTAAILAPKVFTNAICSTASWFPEWGYRFDSASCVTGWPEDLKFHHDPAPMRPLA